MSDLDIHHGSPTADPGTTYYFPNTTQMHLWANETCFECLAACIPHFTEVSQGWDCLHIVPTSSRPIGSMQCRYTFPITFSHIYIYIYLYQLTTYSFPSCRVNRYLQYHSIALQVCIRCVVQTSTSKWCLHLGRYASIFVSPLLLSVVDIAVCSLAPSLLCSLARLLFPLLQMQ